MIVRPDVHGLWYFYLNSQSEHRFAVNEQVTLELRAAAAAMTSTGLWGSRLQLVCVGVSGAGSLPGDWRLLCGSYGGLSRLLSVWP